MGPSKLRRMSMVFAGLTLAVAVTATAVAGDAVKQKSKSETLAPQEEGSAKAKCKRGTAAIAGGFSWERFFSDSPGDTVLILGFGSHPAGKRGWKSSAFNLGPNSGDVTSSAYCRDQKVKRKSAETVVGEGTSSDPATGTATAKCPRGTKALSGGFDNPDFDVEGADAVLIMPGESKRVGKRKWRVEGASLGQPGTLKATVVCAESASLKAKEATETPPGSGDTEVTEVTAKCGRGQRVVSGGFSSSVTANVAVGPLFFDSHRSGNRGWLVTAVTANGITPEITAHAYCEEK